MGGEKKYNFTAKYSAKTDASTSVNVTIGKDKKSANVAIRDRNLLHLYIMLLLLKPPGTGPWLAALLSRNQRLSGWVLT